VGDRTPADRGFTLVEVLVVTLMMGIIAAAVVGTVSVVFRNAPSAEERANDARSLQGLVTWLPQDVDAAPPDGFSTDPAAWPCAGTAPTGTNILSIGWTEQTDDTYRYATAYRYEQSDLEWHMARYACEDGGSGTMSTPTRINLTSELPPWDIVAPPAHVVMCDEVVDVDGNCPAGHEIATYTSPDVRSLKLTITRTDGVESTIDAAPKNPDQDLADDPYAVSNASPQVDQINDVVEMYPGDSVVVDLTTDTAHHPFDPDGDPISLALDFSEPMPAGITAATIDPMSVELTTDPGLSPGTVTDRIFFVIADNRAGWVGVTLRVKILNEPNDPPTALATVYPVTLGPGDEVILPLDVTHDVLDPNGDPLTLSVLDWPPELLNVPEVGAPLGELEVRLLAPSVILVTGPVTPNVRIRVSDPAGAGVDVEFAITLVDPAPPNNPPTATVTDVPVTMYAGDTATFSVDVSHGVSDPDGHPLKLDLLSAPAGVTAELPRQLEVELTADAGLAPGTLAPVEIEVSDIKGATIVVRFTIEIVTEPEPASDCVLGTLTASPSAVARQGNGQGARHLQEDVLVTVTYTGSCDGLVLTYDTGDTSGLGIGSGRVFPAGSPSTIVIYASGNGGTEKWTTGNHVLTASTTSAVTPNTLTTTLTVS
jgi:prepilin-type N-terminal cleavage/methylation domain-containing protein